MTNGVAIQSKHISTYDYAKAIGIVLVVVGHSWSASSVGVRLIYGFHMPLFFFVSGALLKDSSLNSRWLQFVQKQVKSLLIPYLFFCLFILAVLAFRRALPFKSISTIPLVELAWGIPIGSSWSTRELNSTVWFFTALFVTAIFYYILVQWMSRAAVVFVAVVTAVSISVLRPPDANVLPWNLDIVPLALSFYATGHLMAGSVSKLSSSKWPFVLIASGLFCMVVGGCVAYINHRVDMRDLVVGNPILFFISAFFSIFGILLIFSKSPRLAAVEYVSARTIVIFPLHMIPLSLLLGMDKRLFSGMSQEFESQWWRGLLYAVISILICLPSYAILLRWAPWAIGGRSRSKQQGSLGAVAPIEKS
jgi:acyltransferase